VIAFLRALERCGEARTAAKDAGIDHTTAYARRKRHAEFGCAWEAALKAHAAAKKRAEAEEIAAVEDGTWADAPSRKGRGTEEELVVSGGQVKRAGFGRWSKRKEKIFFNELAATANARMAAAAVGMTKNAVLQRRLRHPVFAAKWDSIVASAKANINLYLVEASNKTFDPDELDTGDVQPKVTIDQAIKIAQIGAAAQARTGRGAAADPFQEEKVSDEEADELRERLVRRLMRLQERGNAERAAQGWTWDETHQVMVPPGWARASGEEPGEAEGE
jgi:hypothetical protein